MLQWADTGITEFVTYRGTMTTRFGSYGTAAAFLFVFAIAGVLGACDGCSSDPGVGETCEIDDDCADGAICDDGLCVTDIVDDVGLDTPDGDADTDLDAPEEVDSSETDGEDTDTGETDDGGDAGCDGQYQCECTTDDDCDSSLCVRTELGNLCSRLCFDDEDCADDAWECRLLRTGSGDVAEICVPIAVGLCADCETDEDCTANGSLCNALADGNFCTTDCTDSDCPEGYGCEEITRVEDGTPVSYDQCVPLLGVCGDCLDVDGDGYGTGSACLGDDCDDTLTSVYVDAPEICDNIDNDCDLENDEDYTDADGLYNSQQHCGGCGQVCAADFATVECQTAVCTLLACDDGYADCNDSLDDGCETPTASDEANCGGCGVVCDFANANGVCNTGECALISCETGWGNCDDNQANGCEEDVTDDFFNCGVCGQTCDLENAVALCDNSACSLIGCDFGWQDCNTNLDDGCEAFVVEDVLNCGTCGNICSVNNAVAGCDGGACAIAECLPGFADCNTNNLDGCEVDLGVSRDNCGACGDRCVFANGVGECDEGTCELVACNNGFSDCDGNSANGCEVDLRTDSANCGACTNICDGDNASLTCVAGDCEIASCDAGFDDCDLNANNGCEVNLATNVNNCGSCGLVCAVGGGAAACVNNVCGINSCDTGLADCDGLPGNGCETDLTTSNLHCGACFQNCTFPNGVGDCESGVCGLVGCNTGFADCNGDPIDGCEMDLRTNYNNCGTCGKVCDLADATGNCNAGTCEVIGCDLGFDDCDQVDSNGCETNLLTSTQSCGVCGTQCEVANGDPVCNGGACGVAGCDLGYGNCDGGYANGCEAEFATNEQHCGGCNIACEFENGVGACVAGGCQLVGCDIGYGDCNGEDFDGCEVDLRSSVDHCNACGNACSDNNATPQCDGGVCEVFDCEDGFEDCDANPANGCEINLNTNVSNCGGCGDICSVAGGDPECVQGSCEVSLCTGDLANCDGDPANGCEIDLNADENNCGGCDNVCSYPNGTGDCAAGSCVLAGCSAPFADCDSDSTNGCEANTTSDDNNCSSCGNVCNLPNATSTCSASECRIVSCNSGFADCDGTDANGCEVDLSVNRNNCGSCDNACSANNGTAFCDGGSCAIQSCDSTHGDCDGSYSNGCEAPLNIDEANCGTCGTTCEYENGIGLCTGGSCSMSGCQSNWGDCDSSNANGCETFLVNNINDCGTCGNECSYPNAAGTCNTTSCALQNCNLGYENCDGSALNGCEVFVSGDTNNCGGCGSVCSLFQASENCTNGFCGVASCNGGFDNCNGIPSDGCEINLNSDVNNCGSCGNVCPSAGGTAVCNNGTCGISGCTAPLADCDLDGTSCETNTNNSVSNCGNCGNDCDAGASNATMECDSGVCDIDQCDTGFDDCNTVTSDGCETNITSSLAHCGGCGNVCSIGGAVEECSSATCSFVTCDSDRYDLDGDMNDGYQGGDNGCEYFCTGDPLATDSPDSNGTDDNCDGIDGDIANSIFVARSTNGGSNSHPGTPEQPVATIAFAINAAASCPGGPCDVIVSGGTYDESITMIDGVNLYGGFDAGTWTRDISINETIIRGQSTVAVTADALTTATTLDGFTVQGFDAPGSSGGATIAVLVSDSSSNFSIGNCTIEGGTGGDGADGEDGTNGASGLAGGSSNSSSGAAGATSTCGADGGDGASGRACTDGAQSGGSGDAGSDASSGGGGGSAGSNSCSCSGFSGGDGGDGGAATAGGNGAQGGAGSSSSLSAGSWVGGVWTPSTSGPGTRGKNGTGGGGGGSGGSDRDGLFGGCINARTGGGGGGGGAGGCAGTAGGGGTQGGASFAVVVVNSVVDITDTEIKVGTGGDGGAGGPGGDGGASGGLGAGAGGSGGGFLSEGAGDGGNGAAGGKGGGGGGGAGGCGGPAIGIAQVDGGTANQTAVSFSGGTGGAVGSGGPGGSLGGDGANAPSGADGCVGAVEDTYTY